MSKFKFSFDTETYLIRDGMIAPKMVCASWAHTDKSGLELRQDAMPKLVSLIRDNAVPEWQVPAKAVIIGHNLPYDLGVIAAEDPSVLWAIFDRYERGMFQCTMARQKLIDAANGHLKFYEDEDEDEDEDTGKKHKNNHTLEKCAYRLLNREMPLKNHPSRSWRLRYSELDNVPISEWPEDAAVYAREDAEVTRDVYAAQEEIVGSDEIPWSTETHQAAWALHLMSMWGVRTDAEATEKLGHQLREDMERYTHALKDTGLVRPVGSKNMKVIMERITDGYRKQGLGEPPRTEGGSVATGGKILLASGDPDLKVLASRNKTQKLLTTYLPILQRGAIYPINSHYDFLKETGRTGCAKPNLQNPPRKGGVRECFIPRNGFVFVSADYDTSELRSLAQVCLDLLGHSSLADALNQGLDPHLDLAAQCLGLAYEEALARYTAGDVEIEEWRQLCKIANFGFPGGMSAGTFVEYAAGYDKVIDLGTSETLQRNWKKRWPEMIHYFRYVSNLCGRGNADEVVHPRTGYLRGDVRYTATCNGFFQHYTAAGAKRALWRVTKECYVKYDSPLYGSRPVMFLHDEIIMETPDERDYASRAADRLAEVMRSAMAEIVPDVKIRAKPVMMRRWYKGANPIRKDGFLVPSKPVAIQKDGRKATIWVED